MSGGGSDATTPSESWRLGATPQKPNSLVTPQDLDKRL